VKIGAGLQVSSGTVNATPPQAGYFSFSSATLVQFCPENGAFAQVAGAVLTIPSACATAANTSVQVFSTGTTSSTTNLANSTLYYVGVLNNSGSLAIAFFPASAYSHMPDTTAGNLGVEVLSSSGSPLTNDTLVGMVYTNSSGQFQQQVQGALSWFNRLIIRFPAASVGNVSTSAGSLTQLGTATLLAMKWSTEALPTNVLGSVLENNSSGTGTIGIGSSGACASTITPTLSITGNSSSIYAPLSLTDYSTFSNAEGAVTMPLCGNSGSSSFTLTINGALINATTHG
jgi:hypothetical protein